ncbi:MAG: arylsulfate sulfotransferase N-terminal domain-containing protein [Chitinophagaceae bacterium]|nr:arylsulfate sulfotransferase N-terminal domain-containing protein [Chitinophagaceae bacterium]
MKKLWPGAIAAVMLIAACKKDKNNTPNKDASKYITSKMVEVNPTGFAPLTATITLGTTEPTRVHIKVTGKHGPDSDVTKEFEEVSTTHSIPVLGLYGGYDNQVEVTLFDASGVNLGSTNMSVPTDTLHADLPDIKIDVAPTSVQQKMTLVSYYGYAGDSQFPFNPFIFDDYGDIRWYIDHTNSDMIKQLSIQDGLE